MNEFLKRHAAQRICNIEKHNPGKQMVCVVKPILDPKKEEIFVNDATLTENIVNYIICEIKRSTSNILDERYRENVKNEAKITEKRSTITNQLFAFSETYELYARFK